MVQRADLELDDLDLSILKEMEADGRQSISALAKTLGISRAYAGKRLQSLLDRNITRIVTFTDPRVLGLRTMAIVGIQVSLADLHSAADRLRALPSVHLVMITAGPHNIVIEAMFANPEDLSGLLTRDLGNIPGIKSIETTTVLEWRKMSFAYLTSSGLVGLRPRRRESPPSERTTGAVSDIAVDDLDLQILNELETDGRQPVSELAKKLGTSRAHMSSRLQRILEQGVARVVAHTDPMALGYRLFAMIGIKALPSDTNAIADKLRYLPNINAVVIVAGRHDIIIWTMFHTPIDLSAFLEKELGGIPGIISAECTILLELRKMSFPYLVRSHLAARGGPKVAKAPPAKHAR
ncbi:MAG: Lrp/AsnC family transcriptional regulator [Dehalococcoidia bacterium]|nr:Lrp/AsnC family transcriptional regulator [Dehalococcoidia bacterium]